MKQRIIITGFDAFGTLRENPSEVLSRAVAANHPEVSAITLRTSYTHASRRVLELLNDARPTLLLMLGYSRRASGLRFEPVAANRDTSSHPDNDGDLGTVEIVHGGPDEHASNVDISALVTHLAEAGVSAYASDYVTGFVCNHAYYVALHAIEREGLGTRCLFAHVPTPADDDQFKELQKGVEIAISQLRSEGP